MKCFVFKYTGNFRGTIHTFDSREVAVKAVNNMGGTPEDTMLIEGYELKLEAVQRVTEVRIAEKQ